MSEPDFDRASQVVLVVFLLLFVSLAIAAFLLGRYCAQ